jgi:hypothetical protein
MSKTFTQVVIGRPCFFDAEGYKHIPVKTNKRTEATKTAKE